MSNISIDTIVWKLAKKTKTIFLIILPFGFAFSVIPWSAFLILAPGPDDIKVYYISSVGYNSGAAGSRSIGG
jgi:hypothetical protein